MQIEGLPQSSRTAVEAAVAAGGRFVVYEYCISLIAWTLRRPSAVWYLRPGEVGIVRGLPYSLISLLLGWWGLPWGMIYTPLTLLTNCAGGHDLTADVLKQFRREDAIE